MITIITCASIWLIVSIIRLRFRPHLLVKTMNPEPCEITQGYGWMPRLGDEFVLTNHLGCSMSLVAGLLVLIAVYFAFNPSQWAQIVSMNGFVVYLVIACILLGGLLFFIYRNQMWMAERLKKIPRGNCLILYHSPMVMQRSRVFTLNFNLVNEQVTDQGIGQNEPHKGAPEEDDLPRMDGGRMRGIYFKLPRHPKGKLHIKAMAPAFNVIPEFREIPLPKQPGIEQCKFVVLPTQKGRQTFLFELFLGQQQVGSFEAIIPVYSVALDRATRVLEFAAILATILTFVLDMVKYLRTP